MDRPLVSVRMITYNQEKYIAEAIESVLKQKVDFQYELIIGEDASTDNTAAIVDHYQEKYPEIIKVFHRRKNLGMQMNCRLTMEECRGKYVAVLAGDDYWTYEGKLQKQVEYLERNQDVVGTAHNVYSCDANGDEAPAEYIAFPMQRRHIYSKHYVMCLQQLGHSSSFVYRNIKYLLNREQWESFLNCRLNGDVRVSYTLGMLGRCVYFEDIWSCSRRLLEGEGWLASTYQQNLLSYYVDMDLETYKYLSTVFGINIDISQSLLQKIKLARYLAIESATKENIVIMLKVYISYIRFQLKKWRLKI
jgi:glycosyltransferase involved in cell wall biosynthesis